MKVFLQNKYLFHFHICDLKCPRNNILKTLSCPGKKKHRTGAFCECLSAKRINEFMWHYLIATAQKIVRSHRSWLQHQKLWNGNKISILFSSCLHLLYSVDAVSWQHCESNIEIFPVKLRSIIQCSSSNQDTTFRAKYLTILLPPCPSFCRKSWLTADHWKIALINLSLYIWDGKDLFYTPKPAKDWIHL